MENKKIKDSCNIFFRKREIGTRHHLLLYRVWFLSLSCPFFGTKARLLLIVMIMAIFTHLDKIIRIVIQPALRCMGYF